MGQFATTARVVTQNRLGQFASDCERAAGESVSELLDEGIKISKSMAPVGSKPDKRTAPIRASFFKEMLSRTQGVFGNSARHALAQEKGARPHLITGNLKFYWEAARREWIPAAAYYGIPGLQDIINHPGHGAQPFLGPAYDVVKHRALAIMRKHYPGGVR